MKKICRFLDRYAFALTSCAYLFTLGWLRRRNRTFLNEILRHFSYHREQRDSVMPSPQLPRASLAELAPEDVPFQLRAAPAADGNVSDLELVALAKLAATHGPRRLLEIGTFDGRTTLNLAANSAPDAEVYTLDLPRSAKDATRLPLAPLEDRYVDKDQSGARYRGTDCEAKIHQLYGDSATCDLSFLTGTLDFVFIDGSHSYEYVLSDTRRALSLLRPEGTRVVAWHDYGMEGYYGMGVTPVVDELTRSGEIPGQPRWLSGTSLVVLVLT